MRRFASNVRLSSCIRVRSDLDTALLACAAGDEDGLKRIYDQEATRLLGMAYRIVGERDLAEDVLQDAFLQIWQYASSFDANRGSARGWIYCVVRNRAIKVRLARLHEVAIEDRILLAMFDGNAVQVSRLPENCALRRGLEQLDPKRRDSLILAYVYGCTHDEIAERLGVPIGTAKAWIRRSLITLRALLA
ncbi:sigma-70 family RNA polymerase sigma factor [Ensifer aridi]